MLTESEKIELEDLRQCVYYWLSHNDLFENEEEFYELPVVKRLAELQEKSEIYF